MLFNSVSRYPGLDFGCMVRYFSVISIFISASSSSVVPPTTSVTGGFCVVDCEGIVADGYFVELCSSVLLGKVWSEVVEPLIFMLRSHPDERSDAAIMRSAVNLIKNFFMRIFLSGRVEAFKNHVVLNRLFPINVSDIVLCIYKGSPLILSYYGYDVKKDEIYIFN